MISPIFDTVVRTNRTVLAPVTSEDADALYDILSDQDIRSSYGFFDEAFFADAKVEAVRRFCTLLDAVNQQGAAMACTVRLAENPLHVIGYIAVGESEPDTKPGQWEIGYFLAKEHQGQGLAKEMVAEVLSRAQTDFGITEFFTYVKPENMRSAGLLEDFGFVAKGETAWSGPYEISADCALTSGAQGGSKIGYFEKRTLGG
jgi:RimJ/RimL family protein N-acetyltransferase